MRILFRSATLCDPRSPHHLQTVDLLVEDGIITRIGNALKVADAAEISAAQLYLTSGFVDTFSSFRDPGMEHQEDLHSGLIAAAKGGYTAVCVQPDTFPVTQHKGGISYWINKSAGKLCRLIPAAALTLDLKGIDLTEMMDLHQAGAQVFSNANVPVMDAGTQMRALQYIRHFDGLMYSLPIDMNIARGGMVNEGVQSTQLGLKGIPDMAEELMVVRDIALVEYTGSRLHFAKISTAGSVKLIREAKKRGLSISCGVAAHHLLLTDEVLTAFDTHTKVFPPLRDKADQQALIDGVKDGTIDVICADHQPEDVETKFKEFDLANFGAIGLETAFSVALTGVGKKMKLEQLLLAFNRQPAQLLGLEQPIIAEGQAADLVAFDPSLSWEVSANEMVSKSANSPFIGKKLSGKILLTLCNNQLYWNK